MIEGIPDGWELVRIGKPKVGEYYIDVTGSIYKALDTTPTVLHWYMPIIRKIEKPKQYRPFANAAEFEPHRDRWIQRSDKHDTLDTIPAGCFRVTAYNDHHFWTVFKEATSYEKAFGDGKCFDDGTPFGIEVTE